MTVPFRGRTLSASTPAAMLVLALRCGVEAVSQGGDVLKLADPVEWAAAFVAQEGEVRDRPDDRAVRPYESLLTLEAAAPPSQHVPCDVDVELAVVGVGELLISVPEHLLFAASEQLAQRAVDANVLAIGVEDGHADRSLIEPDVEVPTGFLDEVAVVELTQHA